MTTSARPRKDPQVSTKIRIPQDLYERLLAEQRPRETLGAVLRRLLVQDDDDDAADLS
jgi:hypothetical protein